MRQFAILIFLLLSSFCWAQGSGDFQPSSTNVWGAEYPRVDSNGRVQIRVKAPDATKVKLNFWSGPESGHGEANGRILDRHYHPPCSRLSLLHLEH